MRSLLKSIIAILMLMLVTACVQQSIRDRNSAFFQVPVGSTLVLHDTLEIKPGHTRLFVQRGVVTKHSDLDQYWPSCSFEVRDLKETPQQIQPDSFSVVRVQQGETEIVSLVPIQVAALNLSRLAIWDGGNPLVSRFYHLWLTSAQQPNVMRITCYGAQADLPEADLPLFMEIEAALGPIATIQL
jgi:hypothetical protein